MPLVVQKYGGSSLASPQKIQQAAARIQALKTTGTEVVVVVSAMGHMTDHLLKLAHKTVENPPGRELDMLLTAGERVSMSLLAMSLQSRGIPAISFTGSQSGILTTQEHTHAKIIEIRPHRIREELARDKVVIIAGFQGVCNAREITTLGRGGSDTTAVALASVLKADRCEILTDVKGLYTADPRLVPEAKLMEHCGYEEALELAYRGAKLQARSVELAKQYRVKVWISASDDISGTHTEISENKGMAMENRLEQTLVKGITTKDNFSYFEVKAPVEFLTEIDAPIYFFQSRKKNTSFLGEGEYLGTIRNYLRARDFVFQEVPEVTLISAVGNGIKHSVPLLKKFLDSLQSVGAETLCVGSDSLSIFAAISSKHKTAAAKALHATLLP